MHPKIPQLVKDMTCRRSMLVLSAFLVLFLSASCGQRQTPEPAGFQLELLPPEHGVPYLDVRLLDETGSPVTGALVGVEGNMNHAGMVPVISRPVADTDSPSDNGMDDAADGVYHVPFEFTMLGDWIITVTAVVDVESGNKIARDFDVVVETDRISVKAP